MQKALVLTRRQTLQLALGLGASTALSVLTSARPALASAWAGPAARLQAQEQGAQIIVGDVLEFTLDPAGRWPGPFGSVTLRLHEGFVDNESVWFIRTDASDQEFALGAGLVWVPLLASALNAPGSFANLYLFPQGISGQHPVLSTMPGRENFTPAWRVHWVSFTGAPELLKSEQAIKEAVAANKVRLVETNIIVNYPMVKWPGGGLPKDTKLSEYLGTGPLIEDPDTTAGKVTFKLHQCFPGSRYIVTDTSAVPMAGMMGVVGSAPTQKLSEARATDSITVFANGLKGPGVMGFQPAVFGHKAGDPAWSPFWDHFTVRWKDPSKAVVLRSQPEIEERVKAGDLERFNGVPDTHPNGFVVNCPSPVLAPNTYTGA